MVNVNNLIQLKSHGIITFIMLTITYLVRSFYKNKKIHYKLFSSGFLVYPIFLGKKHKLEKISHLYFYAQLKNSL